MNQDAVNDIAIEAIGVQRFGRELSVTEVIAEGVPTGGSAQGTLFKTSGGQLWLLITAQGPLVLGDVYKMVLRMNLQASVFEPPNGEPDYFDRLARDKFKAMFPGKHIVADDDLRYYKSLAPYNPALVRIARVNGEIRGYNPHTKSWHKVKDYTYTNVKLAPGA